jgi:photosystem II stability/assembly factor-like uncharacterized protein
MVPDGNRGWVIGTQGAILATNDGGKSWLPQTSGITDNLLSLTFLADGRHGWVVGVDGTMLFTGDGGNTWVRQNSRTKSVLHSIVFLDDQRGWASGSEGTIVRTVDGGKNWTTQSTNTDFSINSITFLQDGKQGWAVGERGTILTTSNGGDTWTPHSIDTEEGFDSVIFLANGIQGRVIGRDGSIFTTIDGGKTWTRQSSGSGYTVRHVIFANDGAHGMAAGVNGILKTEDGGRNWVPQTIGEHARITAVTLLPDTRRGWAVSADASIFATTDGGGNWAAQAEGNDEPLYSIAFSDDGSHSWAVGSRGTILTTANGWKNWFPQKSNTPVVLESVVFLANDTDGWAVGHEGTIIATSNGGKTWAYQKSGTESNLNSVMFLRNGTQGWITGDDGKILNTIDRGKNWTQQVSGTQESLYNVFFLSDGKHGWSVGRHGIILFTNNGGKNWTAQKSGVESDIKSILFFEDGKRGWAASRDGTILATTNGGESWFRQASYPSQYFNTIRFSSNEKQGWAIGSSVVTTQDGGRTWMKFTEKESFRSAFVLRNENAAFAVGDVPQIVAMQRTKLTYPIVTAYQIEHTPVNEVLKFYLSPGTAACDGEMVQSRLSFRFAAGTEYIPLKEMDLRPVEGEISTPFNPGKMQIERGSKYALRLELSCGNHYAFKYDIDKLTYGDWIAENVPGGYPTAYGILAIGVYLLSLFSAYLIAPSYLFALRRGMYHPALDVLPSWLTAGLRLLAEVTGLWLCKRPRVIDSWVNSHWNTWKVQLEALEPQVFTQTYQPLPIEIGDRGTAETVSNPTPTDMGRFFGSKAKPLQIIGVGGAGKTTLAMQLCRWQLGAHANDYMGSHRRLPIWLDGEFSDLATALDGKLRLLLNNNAPDPLWRNALIDSGRICIVADRLSEQTKPTQKAILNIFQTWPSAMLIVTARHSFTIPLSTTIRPLPIDSLPVIVGLIEHNLRDLERNNGEYRHHQDISDASTTLAQDGQIVNGLIRIIVKSPSIEGKIPQLTPLLIRLFVNAIKNAPNTVNDQNNQPASVPEIYFSYLRSLFKIEDEAYKTDDAIISAAFELAQISLGDRYVPGLFWKNSIKKRFANESVLSKNENYTRLVNAGLLQAEDAGDDTQLRFVLDTLAEYMAAFKYAEVCDGDPEQWQTLIDKARAKMNTDGFITALENVYSAYAGRRWQHMSLRFR